jgi:orotate phosphoribosyltransferase
MAASDVGAWRTAPRPADLGAWYLAGAGKDAACLPEEDIAALAQAGSLQPDPAEREHLLGCARCLSLLASYRSIEVVRAMPSSWNVRLEGPTPPRLEERQAFPYQVLGRVNLDRRRFEPCDDEGAWQEHPVCIRVNLVIDPDVDALGVTLLEVPDRFDQVSLRTPRGWEPLEQAELEGTYEIFRRLSDYLVTGEHPTYPLESFLDYVGAGLLELAFRSACEKEGSQPAGGGGEGDDDAFLLTSLGAVESGRDYELPSGLHVDRYVNVGALCHSEGSLHALAAAFNALFRDVVFDAVVGNGWAMATIGRRLAALRAEHAGCESIPETMFEGYSPPVPVEDIRPGSRVLLLVDVVITGGLVRSLEEAIIAAGAEVVAQGCLVHPGRAGECHPGLRALFRLGLDLRKPGECPRCGVLEHRAFNPFSSSMTARAPEARSPSEFLQYDQNALAFWEKVNEADAYEYHRVERDCHYMAFVDTAKLLKDPAVGPAVVEQLRDLLAEHHVVPDVIIVPNRLRAKLLARVIAGAFGPGQGEVPVLVASRRRGRWQLPRGDEGKLAGQVVLLLDSAAGHGKTLDLLALLASRAAPRSVAAAVLLSRLTDGCERAFARRLSGGFYSLFRLPIRPLVIHGASRELCPFCQRRDAVHKAALDSRLEGIRRLDAALSRARRPAQRPAARRTDGAPAPEHPALFPSEAPSFLETCTRKVASGVALHSFYAAMTNGMAAMKLPELTAEAIPHENRAAMLEHLPPGVVEWSRGELDQDLERCLATVTDRALWRATVEVLARERHAGWIHYLDAFLTRAARLKKAPTQTFWNSMTCNAYLVARRDPERKGELREQLQRLLHAYEGSPTAKGLKQMLEAVGS